MPRHFVHAKGRWRRRRRRIQRIANRIHLNQAVLVRQRPAQSTFIALIEQPEQILGANEALDQASLKVKQLEKVLIAALAIGPDFVARHQQRLLPNLLLLLVLEYDEVDLGPVRADQIQRVLTAVQVDGARREARAHRHRVVDRVGRQIVE